jgi:aspartyl-tRNA synthetase
MYRTHYCGRLTEEDENQEVQLAGWINTRRDHGKISFIDLRDISGIVQVVLVPQDLDEASNKLITELRPEFVLSLTGIVKKRSAKQINPNIPSGKIEILAKSFEILNKSKTPPFEINEEENNVNEELRLKYRYLDLRKERMKNNILLRYKIVKFIRDFFHEKGFIEIETPNLAKGTPEGAREFLVPSRLHPGKFYVLPQSPQQFKQLLMVAGMDKYFQIARCFRDEDQRGDRQPEFTQLDLEMSFVEREDVISLIEEALIKLVQALAPEKKIQQIPFPRISYAEAMAKYQTDRPDVREDKNDPNLLAFCWVLDFPFFEKTDPAMNAGQASGWTFTHNPFSAAKPEYREWLLNKEKIGEILTTQYDIVLNGFEIGGGSIRNHEPLALQRVFEIMGLDLAEIKNKFGHMIEAFEYGAPPHGGIAWGLDRIVAILANEPNIREVIAFPKTGDARDPMMDAPSDASAKQLKEVHIRLSEDVEIEESPKSKKVFEMVRKFLDDKKVAYELMHHKPVYTSQESAKVRGTDLEQGARALVFKADGKYIMVISSAARKVDTHAFKSLYDIRDLPLASADEVIEVTGSNIGAVPPFGNLFGLPVYVDKSLGENEMIAFNAGLNTESIKMKYEDWVKAVKPIEGDFSKEE